MNIQKLIVYIITIHLCLSFASINYSENPQEQRQELFIIFEIQIQKFNRSYQSQEEEKFRFQIFKQNFEKIQELNEQQKEQGSTYNLNQFFDVTDTEFSAKFQFNEEYLNSEIYQSKSKLFDHSEYQSNQLLNEDTKNEFLQHIFENDQIDPIKLILEVRQNKKNNKDDFFDSNNFIGFDEFFFNEHLFKLTKFDMIKEEQNLGQFFAKQFPDYDVSMFVAQFDMVNDQGQQQKIDEFIQNENIQEIIQQNQINDDIKNNNISERRLQNILNLFPDKIPSQINFSKDDQSINSINRQYFQQRMHHKEHPQFKNPFDQISNNAFHYNQYTKQRTHQNTDINKNSWNKKTVVIDGIEIPAYLNWNENGLLNNVKDQLSCNACYAFGANASIEAHQILKNKNFQTYSEQEVLDCNITGNDCQGGQPYLVYEYIKKFGIHSNQSYPYQGKKLQCQAPNLSTQKNFNLLKGYLFVKQGMKNLILATAVGPSVVISYASQYFKFFGSGIYYGQECKNDENPNHTSLVYGYNFNAPVPYLMLKTNWGDSFGVNGHFKQAIGDLTDDNYGKCYLANTPYNVMPIVQLILIFINFFNNQWRQIFQIL